ncbi:response regulator transcription factor [Pirellulaceae bacterium SH449]
MTLIIPTIHLIDDDDSLRKAVSRLLKAAGYNVKTYASSGDFMMADVTDEIGCIILDVRMPGPSGLELQSSLVRRSNSLPIIFLTGHGDIPMSVRAIKAGAIDFLTKPVQRKDLLSAIQNALDQQAKLRTLKDRNTHVRECYESLTQREREIFALVVEGKLNKQIAATIGISERTVKAHRAQVMAKMQVSSLAELVRVAGEIESDLC